MINKQGGQTSPTTSTSSVGLISPAFATSIAAGVSNFFKSIMFNQPQTSSTKKRSSENTGFPSTSSKHFCYPKIFLDDTVIEDTQFSGNNSILYLNDDISTLEIGSEVSCTSSPLSGSALNLCDHDYDIIDLNVESEKKCQRQDVDLNIGLQENAVKKVEISLPISFDRFKENRDYSSEESSSSTSGVMQYARDKTAFREEKLSIHLKIILPSETSLLHELLMLPKIEKNDPIVVPPLDNFAKKKKNQNSAIERLEKSISSSAADFRTISDHFRNVMELKAQVLKNKLHSKIPTEKEVFLVKGDSFINILSIHWTELTLEQQHKLFRKALNIIEEHCSVE